jgi:hypothetical protein
MEHRCTERYSSDLKILIYKHNLPVAIGRVKNGSKIGVFIETDFSDFGCEHQLSLMVLASKSSSFKVQHIEMKALVIHKSDKGFGAALDFVDDAHANLFVDMLKGDQAQWEDSQLFSQAANG